MKRLASTSDSYGQTCQDEVKHSPCKTSKKALYQLAFPKGTCVLRFSDLSADNVVDTIWQIENHILIRKLILEEPLVIGKPVYFRLTNRYQGWFYDEPWSFMQLTTVTNTKTVDDSLSVIFPSSEMIQKAYEVAERQRQQNRLSENSSRLQLERKVQQLKAIKTRRKKGKKNPVAAEEDDDECHGCNEDEDESHRSMFMDEE